MIAFVDDHCAVHGVEPICKVLPIAPSTYREAAARRRDPGRLQARARRDAVLKVEIERVFTENVRVHGVRKSLPPRRRGSGGNCGARASRSSFPSPPSMLERFPCFENRRRILESVLF